MAFQGSYGFGWGLTTWVKRLLIVNAAVFLLGLVPPGIGTYLALVPQLALLRPWTLVTYAFVHAGLFHLLFNMLALFFFGPPLEARWGGREFLRFYLIAALGGALFSFIFTPNSVVVGASAAVFGVMLAFAMNWPDSPIYFFGIFPIKAKYLVLGLAIIAMLGAATGPQGGTAHFAHLGGFVAGFLYLKFSDSVSARIRRLKRAVPRRRFKVMTGGAAETEMTRMHRPIEPQRLRNEEERFLDEVDRVLDKISEHGLPSLSADERKVLDEASRRYRQN